MVTFSALLALCAGKTPVTIEFPTQRPVTRSVDVFFDLRLNKRLSKQSRRRWFGTPSRPLWRHCNVILGHLSPGSVHFALILYNLTSQRPNVLCFFVIFYHDLSNTINPMRSISLQFTILYSKMSYFHQVPCNPLWTLRAEVGALRAEVLEALILCTTPALQPHIGALSWHVAGLISPLSSSVWSCVPPQYKYKKHIS